MKKTILTLGISALISTNLLAKDIKIGVVMPLTGAIAGYGQMTKKGIDLAHEMQPTLNNKDKIVLVYVDNAGDKAQTANAVNRLISKDKVVAIIGALTSSNSLVVAPIIKKYHTPTVAPVATNKRVTYANPYMNRACFIDPFQGKVAAKFAVDNLHAKTAVVIIDKSQAYSAGLAKNFIKDYKKRGGKVLKVLFITSGDKDFKAILSSIKAANPDIVYAPLYAPEMALILKQAKTLGIHKQFLAGDGVSDLKTLTGVAKDASNNLMYSDHFNEAAAPTKLSKQFVAKYHQKYNNEQVPSFAANGADSYFIIVNAMNKCKNPADKECVAKNITKTKKLEGVTGYITIPKSGNPTKSAVINQVQDSKAVYKATVNP
ncbi:MAG: ABC transporter substrate-binding protein [Epsilonproteobacteria bacterium]|nr:ABC transporter substrate-binding protein [Campylobacterota bacterium]